MSDGKHGASADDEAAAIRASLAGLGAERSCLEQALRTLEAANRAALPLSSETSSTPIGSSGSRRHHSAKGGLEKRLHMQCGPIRHTLGGARDDAVRRTVFVRRSSFHLPETVGQRPGIHDIWQALADDPERTEQIAADILMSVQDGRCPLVLSDRKAQLEKLAETPTRLRGDADVALYRLSGDDGIKRRRALLAEMEARAMHGRPHVLFATAALIGEGFDLPRLDTLFLAMPLSFKGRLIQYAGRLHRTHADKRGVRIHDYLDEEHPITQAMFRRRATAHCDMG